MKPVTLTASPEILDILKRSKIDTEGLTLPEQLARPQYVAVNKFLETAGAKWNRSAGKHVFNDGAHQKILDLIGTGTVVDDKKTFNAFYTPRDLAVAVFNQAHVKDYMRILEPSVGSGRLLEPFLNKIALQNIDITAVELNPDVAGTQTGNGFDVVVGDFLEMTPNKLGLFDRIVMNPPFANNQDMVHVMHAFNFLKSGGRLVAIMCKAFTFGEMKVRKEFRDFFKRNNGEIVLQIAEGTFKESGTGIATVMVQIDSPN